LGAVLASSKLYLAARLSSAALFASLAPRLQDNDTGQREQQIKRKYQYQRADHVIESPPPVARKEEHQKQHRG